MAEKSKRVVRASCYIVNDRFTELKSHKGASRPAEYQQLSSVCKEVNSVMSHIEAVHGPNVIWSGVQRCKDSRRPYGISGFASVQMPDGTFQAGATIYGIVLTKEFFAAYKKAAGHPFASMTTDYVKLLDGVTAYDEHFEAALKVAYPNGWKDFTISIERVCRESREYVEKTFTGRSQLDLFGEKIVVTNTPGFVQPPVITSLDNRIPVWNAQGVVIRQMFNYPGRFIPEHLVPQMRGDVLIAYRDMSVNEVKDSNPGPIVLDTTAEVPIPGPKAKRGRPRKEARI